MKTQLADTLFSKAHSVNHALENGFLASNKHIEAGIFGWLFNNQPVFLFEKMEVSPIKWQIHFTHHCGYNPSNQQWVSAKLDGNFAFKSQAPLVFCPHCVALVDRLFASNLLSLGLENNYDPAYFFTNLIQSFPYIFWRDPPNFSAYKPSKYQHPHNILKPGEPCNKCGYTSFDHDTVSIEIDDMLCCLACASSNKIENTIVSYSQLAHHFTNVYKDQQPTFSTWSEVQMYLPPVWGQLLLFFEENELPLPMLWQDVESDCQTQKILMPLYWPDLGKAVVMHLPNESLNWPNGIEFWSFFDILRQ